MVELIRSGGPTVLTSLRRFVLAEDGQALIEYGLITLLIVIVCIGALETLGVDVTGFLSPVASDL